MNTMAEDDHSSVHSFSVIDDDQNNEAEDDIKVVESDTDESFHDEGRKLLVHLKINKEKSQQKNVDEAFTKSTVKETSVEEVAQVSYHDYIIRIFADIYSSNRKNDRCFYFEPVVMLDRSSIASESNELLKQDLVRFKIKMWDAAIRSKVIDRLRSLDSLSNVKIHEENVRVMPYEEVRLVVNPDSVLRSIRVGNKPLSYRRFNESLWFDFNCDLPSVADSLAENLKKNPELIVNKWELALECRGLALGSRSESLEMTSSKRIEKIHPIWIFNVSTLPCESVESDSTAQESPMDSLLPRLDGYDNEIQDLKTMIESAKSLSIETSIKNRVYEEQIQELQEQIKVKKSSIPVFSVENCTNPTATSGESLGFSTLVTDDKTDHVIFHLPSGIFTVKTAGNYLLNFNAHVLFTSGGHRVDLKVNGNTKVSTVNQTVADKGGYHPCGISALLPLKTGDKVGIFGVAGQLFQSEAYKIRFYGVLLSD